MPGKGKLLHILRLHREKEEKERSPVEQEFDSVTNGEGNALPEAKRTTGS